MRFPRPPHRNAVPARRSSGAGQDGVAPPPRPGPRFHHPRSIRVRFASTLDPFHQQSEPAPKSLPDLTCTQRTNPQPKLDEMRILPYDDRGNFVSGHISPQHAVGQRFCHETVATHSHRHNRPLLRPRSLRRQTHPQHPPAHRTRRRVHLAHDNRLDPKPFFCDVLRVYVGKRIWTTAARRRRAAGRARSSRRADLFLGFGLRSTSTAKGRC